MGIVTGISIDSSLSHFVRAEAYEYTKPQTIEPREVRIAVVIDWTEERILQEVSRQAEAHNVSTSEMLKVILCENPNLDPDAQSLVPYSFSDPKRGIYIGEQEMSYGLAQIHLPDHPDISYEEAIDPQFALSFMARNFKLGHKHWWTCWRNMQ